MTRTPKHSVRLVLAASTALMLPALAAAQEVTIVREVDSNNYDPHRSTARAAAEVLFMLGDTLVSLEPDMQTLSDGLAHSWEVSDDGLIYTFHLKEGVTFCDGKPLTADDVVWSLSRWVDPETSSPVAWRAGDVVEIRAVDDLTVEYELSAPFSELLYQLTQSFGTIFDRDSAEALGEDFGINGFNGTGPFCWVDWAPRDRMVIERNPNYTWGPSFHDNQGPAHLERITWQIVPEESTRTVALITGQSQITQYVPAIAIEQLRATPTVEVVQSDEAFWTYFMGFKVDKDVVADPVVRQAMNLAVDQEAMAEDLFFGMVEPAFSYISQAALDWNPDLDDRLLRHDVDLANRMLDEAGWERGSDGVRARDGLELRPLAYVFAGSTWAKIAEAVQADLLQIGVGMEIQAFDATVAWSRLATQEFDMFGMSFPYISAGDALNLYFRSENTPTPNRMNWIDQMTDDLLQAGKTATDDGTRASSYGEVLEIVHDAAVWIPLYHEPMFIAHTTAMAPVVPHNIYGAGLYKGLDLRFND
ncbi:ABC transporter substrate-binding protein [Rhodobaculum claviforme]|uniref:Peptide ABC transporter substrate-binding protein n=1 Tax=Rhodobaculum claviforme TaxID=1549854 RepID=A0A934TJ79_9RHOB|nr:ABC transporter substrate-binding protein [Rhodobaculum claviforme]MBK5926511.1 peptide ABC transporter substrate-binding protein [Rhodobaculum claviforme]